MNALLMAMFLVLLIPIYEASKDENIWQKMLAFASIATKTSLMVLVIAVLRDDWMIGIVGVLILSLGNASLMLLAHVLRRTSIVEESLAEREIAEAGIVEGLLEKALLEESLASKETP